MSIKLEWEVSEVPHDDEVPSRNPTHNQKPPVEGAAKDETTGRQPPRLLGGRRWPRLWWLAALAILAAGAGGSLWYTAQAGWHNVSNAVLAAVTYEDQQASQGAANLLLNVQDRGNVDWLAVRRDEALARQPAPLPLPMLNFGQAPPTVADLTVLDTEFMQADVRRQYSTPDGQNLTFTLPQFYRRGTGGDWLRSAPPGSFWGNWLDWHGANLDIRYSERDAAFVSQVATVLDKRLADACAAWAGGCPSNSPVRLYLSGFVGSLEYNPLSNVEVRIELGTTSGDVVTPADYFLSVPSPQIAGLPTDEAGRSYLTDYLTVRLIASLAKRISTSPDGYWERTSQAIQALGLSNADPGYVVSGQRRHNSAVGAAQSPPGNSAPVRNQDCLPWCAVWYTTVPGDTLEGIAAQFNTSAATIERANRLGNPDQLAVGVKLIIPMFTPAGEAP